jgi:hypothetical protein
VIAPDLRSSASAASWGWCSAREPAACLLRGELGELLVDLLSLLGGEAAVSL